MEKNRKTLLLAVCVAVGASMVTGMFNRISFSLKYGDSMQKIMTVKKIIDDYGMYEADEETLADYASMGLAAALEDPYTAYFTDDQFSAYSANLQTTYIGVGATIGADVENDTLVVVAPMDNSPAEKAGVRAGDILVAVDGEKYSSSQITEASQKLRDGEIGSTVSVTVTRENKGTFDLTITRDKIIKETVDSRLINDDIGYIRISEFDYNREKENKNTADEFKEHYDALRIAGMEKMIIDLRNNPGGELSVVSEIADMLLPKGIITYTEDKRGRRETYKSDKNECELPIVVLVNGGSASASEVLTGALKDYEKATIVGTKTYGKGIVQTVIPFTDGSGMSITIAKYYTPNGSCIHEIGIEPDFVVEMDTEKTISELSYDEDLQLQKAVELLD